MNEEESKKAWKEESKVGRREGRKEGKRKERKEGRKNKGDKEWRQTTQIDKERKK